MAFKPFPRHWRMARLILIAGLGAIAWQLPDPSFRGAPQAPDSAPVGELIAPPAKAAAVSPAAAPLLIRSALKLERGLTHGEYAWSEDGVAAGPLWIHVDLARQTLRVVRGTSEIGRAIILYGADDKPTPTGSFRITEKDADHVSSTYGIPMPYMLRLTDDGIAIHGSNVEYGTATHGCIGVPEEFAALLFAAASLGDRVIIEGAERA